MGEVPKALDGDLAAFLREMRDSGALEDTALVFLADHGNDMGLKSLWQHESREEKRHPFLTMVVPNVLLATAGGSRVRDNLETNTQRLVTVYDIHTTFLSLCSRSGSAVESSNGKQRFIPRSPLETRRGAGVPDGPYSLLHDTVPAGRTCAQALVSPGVCGCHPPKSKSDQ